LPLAPRGASTLAVVVPIDGRRIGDQAGERAHGGRSKIDTSGITAPAPSSGATIQRNQRRSAEIEEVVVRADFLMRSRSRQMRDLFFDPSRGGT
jgi:hypothetical protein